MLKTIKKSQVRSLMPRRGADSHKGQNGRVMIVGGSVDYYGAPLLSAMGALYSGADLVHIYVPECNFDAARSLYPDFIVHKYEGEFLTPRQVGKVMDIAREKCDAILIGPGLGKRESTMDAVSEIVQNLHVPTVLDAEAMGVLKKIEKFPLSQPVVITPHRNEFQHLVDRDIQVKADDPKSVILLRSISMDLHINVLLKGKKDFVSSHEGFVEVNETGNAGMTVGGTGDVLAGVVASFVSRGMEAYDAARCAAYYAGHAGDLLFKKKGYNYSASDLALALPYAIDKI